MNTSGLKAITVAVFAVVVGCTGGGASVGDNSAKGAPSVAYDTVVVDPGPHCSSGGVRVDMGIDTNRNGLLDPAEVTASEYVCNGADGGPGAVSLLRMTPEPAGSRCTAGGVRVESGIDSDVDGFLDPSEVTTTQYVCNGVPPPPAHGPTPVQLTFVNDTTAVTGQLESGDYLVENGARADFYSFVTTTAETFVQASATNAELFLFTASCQSSPNVADWGPCYIGRANSLVSPLPAGDYVLMVAGTALSWATINYRLDVTLGAPSACADETPTVAEAPNCQVAAGSSVTVPLHVCPRCDQATAQCLVHMENVGGGQIALEPMSEVCDANPSCPIIDPASCQFAALSCTFTAPSTPGAYTLVVATPTGSISRNLTVVASGPSSCAFP